MTKKRTGDVTPEEVLALLVVGAEVDLVTLRARVVAARLGTDRLTAEALRLAQQLEYPIRNAVWELHRRGRVGFTTEWGVRRRPDDQGG
jgi:hypothetical protein